MRINDAFVLELLRRNHKLNEEQIKGLLDQQKNEKKSLQEVAVETSSLSEKELAHLYSGLIDVPFVEITPRNLDKEVLKLIPERIARQYNAVVFDVKDDGTPLLAMED